MPEVPHEHAIEALRWIAAAAGLGLPSPLSATAGLTIYAHGGTGGAVVTGGVAATIANGIAQRSDDPDRVSVYELDIRNSSGDLSITSVARVSGPAPWSANHSGEIVLRLDWGPVSAGSHSTGQVARVVADFLTEQTIGGRGWIEGPIHAIGHSRGGALVAELAEDLGESGVWVDQVTTLDPHPVDGQRAFFADWGDTFPRRWENIRFFDNYWRTQPGNRADFTGEEVPGAHDVQLSEGVLSNGGNNGCEHCDVPPWYYGTINTSPSAFIDGFTVPQAWYTGGMGPRHANGFAHSRLGGIERPLAGVGSNFGGNAAGASVGVTADNAFPNIASVGNEVVELAVGETGEFAFWSQDYDDDASVRVYLDNDRDPTNGTTDWLVHETQISAQMAPTLGSFELTAEQEGRFYLYAEVSDGEHTRYTYWANPITVGGLLGDFNDDGSVDAADYVVWRDNFGFSEATINNAGDGSGTVDAGDYAPWSMNYGRRIGEPVASITVPEPDAALCLVVALMLRSCFALVRTKACRLRLEAAPLEGVAICVLAASLGSAGEPEAGYAMRRDLLYRDGDNLSAYAREACRLDLYHPVSEGGFSTVVWFHGGGLTSGERKVPVGLRRQGIAVAAADYRLSPTVKSPTYVEDAAAAVAWTVRNIEAYGGDASRVFVSGHSAGGYLTSMVGLDKRWLDAHGVNADDLAGLIPYSGHAITHFTVRSERGVSKKTPVVDAMAPLYHVRASAPPTLLITGDRDKELLGRYEENAYLWRMMRVAGHEATQIRELKGFGHVAMAEPAHPLLLNFVRQAEEAESSAK